MVEIANHRDPPRLRRPHREQHPVDALVGHRPRAQALVELLVGSLHQQVVVERPKDGTEGVGIGKLPGAARSPRAGGRRSGRMAPGRSGLEKAVGVRRSRGIGRSRRR